MFDVHSATLMGGLESPQSFIWSSDTQLGTQIDRSRINRSRIKAKRCCSRCARVNHWREGEPIWEPIWEPMGKPTKTQVQFCFLRKLAWNLLDETNISPTNQPFWTSETQDCSSVTSMVTYWNDKKGAVVRLLVWIVTPLTLLRVGMYLDFGVSLGSGQNCVKSKQEFPPKVRTWNGHTKQNLQSTRDDEAIFFLVGWSESWNTPT